MLNTVLDFLKSLPEPYRSRALTNADHENPDRLELLSSEVFTIQSALTCSFIWKDTAEGYEYWSKLHYLQSASNV